MRDEPLSYVDDVLPRLRYQFCPMCRNPLTRGVLNDDGIARTHCSACGWVQYPTNALGVNVVIEADGGIVLLFPPGEPADAPAALPAGHIEYGESPEAAAVREAYEETGLVVRVVCSLGWYFAVHTTYPGPMVHFLLVTQAIGGILRGSQEGLVQICSRNALPSISPNRGGSLRLLAAYLNSLPSD